MPETAGIARKDRPEDKLKPTSPLQVQGEKPRVRMIIPIWGADYITRWLDLSFASVRADDNIFYLDRHCEFELAIMTKAADATHMHANPRFKALTGGLRVKFISIDEFFPKTSVVPYGIPLTLAYGKGIADLGDTAIGTFVILMNADFMISTGSLKSLVDRIKQGYTIIAAPSIRLIDRTVRPILYQRADRDAGLLTIPPRELMQIVNVHLHNTVRARIVNEATFIDSTYYHAIYWQVSRTCLAARYFLLMPYCFRIERNMQKVLCPVDYGFIAELCPNGRFCAMTDSDDFLMIELQQRDSESHWLRVAPTAKTLEARLERLSGEIATHAATWTTGEHRRFATQTIYFHEESLPGDIRKRVDQFEHFVDGILDAMPPPISHVGHFQWVPAVRIYRDEMARGGAELPVALLDDPRNMVAE